MMKNLKLHNNGQKSFISILNKKLKAKKTQLIQDKSLNDLERKEALKALDNKLKDIKNKTKYSLF